MIKNYENRDIQKRRISLVLVLIFMLGVALFNPVEASMLANSSTSGSVTLVWDSPGDNGADGTAAQYDFRYSTTLITEANWNMAQPVANLPTPLTSGTSQSVIVDGLLPSTTYFFAAKTADEVPNWSELSGVVMRSTLAASGDVTPPAAIGDLQVLSAAASPQD